MAMPGIKSASLSPVILQDCTQATGYKNEKIIQCAAPNSCHLGKCLFAQLGVTLCLLMNCSPPRLLCPGNSPSKNTGVGCHFLLQGIFPTQRSHPHLLCLRHWQVDSLPRCHLGSPCVGINISYSITGDPAFLVSGNKSHGSLTCIPERGHSGDYPVTLTVYVT